MTQNQKLTVGWRKFELDPFLTHGSDPLEFIIQGVVLWVTTVQRLILYKRSQVVGKSVLTTLEKIYSLGLVFRVQELASSYVRRPVGVSIGPGFIKMLDGRLIRGQAHAGSNINWNQKYQRVQSFQDQPIATNILFLAGPLYLKWFWWDVCTNHINCKLDIKEYFTNLHVITLDPLFFSEG